jgi:F0F1-type ATP synthase assembly protein I
MKKSIYFTILFLFTTFLIIAQPEGDTDQTGTKSGFDVMSGLIGLVVGAVIGYFGSKMMGNKNA